MSTENMEHALTDTETLFFRKFTQVVQMGAPLALVRSQIGETDVAVIAHVMEHEDGSYDVHPWAILVTDDTFGLLTNPMEVQ